MSEGSSRILLSVQVLLFSCISLLAFLLLVHFIFRTDMIVACSKSGVTVLPVVASCIELVVCVVVYEKIPTYKEAGEIKSVLDKKERSVFYDTKCSSAGYYLEAARGRGKGA